MGEHVERYALQKRGVNGASCQSPSCNLTHKLRRDVQLIHALNDHADVMTEHLAECFVDLRGRGLTSQSLAKLRGSMRPRDIPIDFELGC